MPLITAKAYQIGPLNLIHYLLKSMQINFCFCFVSLQCVCVSVFSFSFWLTENFCTEYRMRKALSNQNN